MGFVNILNRTEDQEEGKIGLKAEIDGQMHSVNAVLDQSEYARAIQAHAEQATVADEQGACARAESRQGAWGTVAGPV